MSRRSEFARDLLVARYLEALEADDRDVLDAIWLRAETDPELEQALIEFSDGYAREQGIAADWNDDVERVRAVIAEHFPQRPDPQEPTERPLTVADVAARLRADAASGSEPLSETDRAANDRLQAIDTPLPEHLGQTALEDWCRNAGLEGSRHYWRLFRRAAIRLSMARTQQHVRLAAREQNPK